QEERHDRNDRNRRVLLAEIRSGTLLDRPRDLLHLLVAGRLPEQPPGEVDPVQNCHERAHEREGDGVVNEKAHDPPVFRPSQSQRRVAPARPIMYHKPAAKSVDSLRWTLFARLKELLRAIQSRPWHTRAEGL